MANKVFTIARKSIVNGQPQYTSYGPDHAYTDRIEATKALRALGGGQQGDNSIVLWSYKVDEPIAPQPQPFEVVVIVNALDAEDARFVAAAIGEVIEVN